MLLSIGMASNGDYGEQSLGSRFLLSLILNEYSIVNQPDGKAFTEFAKRCLGLSLHPEDIERATATVEFQANRSSSVGDKTTFDLLFTLEPDWIWGIEVKYFDTLKKSQIRREVKAIQNLCSALGYKNSGLLFVTPEQQLGSIVMEDGEVRETLSDFIKGNNPVIKLVSWEMIFDIISSAAPEKLRRDIVNYCEERNRNKEYSAKLLAQSSVTSVFQWEKYITGVEEPPDSLPQLQPDKNSFGSFGQASSTISEVFAATGYEVLAQKIIDLSRCEAKARRSGYVNLTRNQKTFAQLHTNPAGVDLVMPEAANDPRLPACSLLKKIDIRTLSGYSGTNKLWLDGDGKFTKSPAVAFNIPGELYTDSSHPGWKEVEILLSYARTK